MSGQGALLFAVILEVLDALIPMPLDFPVLIETG
jgi:hypothetical protein